MVNISLWICLNVVSVKDFYFWKISRTEISRTEKIQKLEKNSFLHKIWSYLYVFIVFFGSKSDLDKKKGFQNNKNEYNKNISGFIWNFIKISRTEFLGRKIFEFEKYRNLHTWWKMTCYFLKLGFKHW